MVYIYALIDPRTLEVRYVGKSVTPEKRLIAHVCTTHADCNPHKLNWIKELKREGLRPTMNIVEETTNESWPEREKYWIAFYRQLGNNLTNMADGGLGGGSPSEETKRLIGQKTSMRMKNQTIRDHLREIYGRKVIRSDGYEYGSIKIAAEELGVLQHTMRKYIESDEEVDGFKYFWLNNNPKRSTVNNSRIRCVETGEEYDSILEASILLKTSRQAIRESIIANIKIKNKSFEYINKSIVNQTSGRKSFVCVETNELLSMNEIVSRVKLSSRNIYSHMQRGYAIKGFHYKKINT